MKRILRLCLEGAVKPAPASSSVTPIQPVADKGGARKRAIKAVRTAVSNTPIEPDGIAVDEVD